MSEARLAICIVFVLDIRKERGAPRERMVRKDQLICSPSGPVSSSLRRASHHLLGLPEISSECAGGSPGSPLGQSGPGLVWPSKGLEPGDGEPSY